MQVWAVAPQWPVREQQKCVFYHKCEFYQFILVILQITSYGKWMHSTEKPPDPCLPHCSVAQNSALVWKWLAYFQNGSGSLGSNY